MKLAVVVQRYGSDINGGAELHARYIAERLARQFDTTLPRFDVMAALYRTPEGMLMSDLSRFLLVSNGNVTGIIDRLATEGLVKRARRNGDRRTSIVQLTRTGHAAFTRMAAAHQQWVDELLAGVSKAERLWLQSMTAASIRDGFERLRSDQAMRPLADAGGSAQNVAFKNVDGSKVVIVHNTSKGDLTFRVRWNAARSFSYKLPADAVVTFRWSGTT